jgi:hypothetical protein
VESVLAADVNLSVVAKFPNRRHLVPAGSVTTFVVAVKNGSQAAQSVRLDVEPRNAPWTADLQPADDRFQPQGSPDDSLLVTVPAAGEIVLLARLRPPAQASDGEEGEATVTARVDDIVQSAVLVRGKVRNKPKVYFVAIDGIGPNYLDLNRRGGWYDGSTERLMPRASEFRQTAASFTAARALLPACTDVDHNAALSGSRTGPRHPLDPQILFGNQAKRERTFFVAKDLLRWGHREPVEMIYDVIKDEQAGGDEQTFSVFISGKEWVGDPGRRDGAHGRRHRGEAASRLHILIPNPSGSEILRATRRRGRPEGTNVSKSPRFHKLCLARRRTWRGPERIPRGLLDSRSGHSHDRRRGS